MVHPKISIEHLEGLECLDLVSKFVLLTIIRFFRDIKQNGMEQHITKFTFRIDLFYIYYRTFCSEFKELCEFFLPVDAVARSLRNSFQAGLIFGGLNQTKNLWEYSTNLPLDFADELLTYHISYYTPEEQKQIILEIAFRELEKF